MTGPLPTHWSTRSSKTPDYKEARSGLATPVLEVESAQAVARPEENRSEICEPRDEDNRRPGGQVEVIGKEQTQKP